MYIKDKISFQALSSESTKVLEPRRYHGNGKEKRYYNKILQKIEGAKFKLSNDDRIATFNLTRKKILTLDLYSPDNFGIFDAKKQRIYEFEKKGLLIKEFETIMKALIEKILKK